MTDDATDGLTVDAEVRRGDFVLSAGFAAAPGQVVGVLGPNGAGKSTLLSAVAGLTPVSAGRITLAGQVLDDAGSGAFVARYRYLMAPQVPRRSRPLWHLLSSARC